MAERGWTATEERPRLRVPGGAHRGGGMEAGGAPRPDPPPLRRRTRFTELLPAVGSFDPQNTAEQMRFPSVRRERLRGTEGRN